MNYNLQKPCANCPFRTDIKPYLRQSRATEIARSLEEGEFACHKTLACDGDGELRVTQKSEHCAGALIMLEHSGRPSQMMRISERLRMYDRRKLDMDAPVHVDAEDWIASMES